MPKMGKTYGYINWAQMFEVAVSLGLGIAYLRWFKKAAEAELTKDEKEAKQKDSLVYNVKKAIIAKLGGEASD